MAETLARSIPPRRRHCTGDPSKRRQRSTPYRSAVFRPGHARFSPPTAEILADHIQRFATLGPDGLVLANRAGNPLISSSSGSTTSSRR